MDNLAKLHYEYVLLDEMNAPKHLIRLAINRYNKALNAEFDRLEECLRAGLPVPEDFLKPQGGK